MAATHTSTANETTARSRRGRSRAEGRPRDLTERMNLHARSIALGVLIALVGVGAFGRFYTARFNGLVSTEAMEVADIAQQLRFNRGFSTKVVRPLALSYATPDAEGTVPDTRHQPLYPFLVSLLFRIRGGGDASMAMFNGLMFLLTGGVLYALSNRLWDRSIALLTVVLYFVSVEALGAALTAAGGSLTGLLLLTTLWAAVRYRQQSEPTTGQGEPAGVRASLLGPLAVGALFGLTYLSGLATCLLVIPIVFLGTTRSERRVAGVALLVAAIAVTLPWTVRNVMVTGTPLPAVSSYAMLSYTDSYAEDSIFRQLPQEVPSVTSFIVEHPGEMIKKLAWGLTRCYRAVPNVVSPYLFPFFVLGGLMFAGGGLRRELWRVVVAMAALQVLVVALLDHGNTGSLRILTPVVTCLAVGAGVDQIRRIVSARFSQWLLGAAILALLLFASVGSMVLGGRADVDTSRPSLEVLREHLAADAVIASDTAAQVAWYSDKPTVLLPETPGGLESLQQQGLTIDYIYLSDDILGPTFRPAFRDWRQLVGSEELEDLGEVLPLPGRELLIEQRNKRIAQPM